VHQVHNPGIMIASDKEVAPQVLEHPGARPTERLAR
jgi:hypothetical protein